MRELLELGRLAPPGSRLRVEMDLQAWDRYSRLLAYLWLPDGTTVNERILEAGWALLLTVPPNVRHVGRLREAQGRAGGAGPGYGPPQALRARSGGLQKAVLELVVRKSFGPARLQKYGL